MGADDANEGTGPGECPGHDWQLEQVVLAGDGAHLHKTCTRCGADVIVGPDELTGKVG